MREHPEWTAADWWNDAETRMRDALARCRPILGDVLMRDLAGAAADMMATHRAPSTLVRDLTAILDEHAHYLLTRDMSGAIRERLAKETP